MAKNRTVSASQFGDVSSTTETYSVAVSTSTHQPVTTSTTGRTGRSSAVTSIKDSRSFARIEKAVYAHIRAIRSLGRTTVNTAQIARALSVPIKDVDQAVAKLRTKGVRLASK